MNKKIFIFTGVILFLMLLCFMLYKNLEIYDKKAIVFPSRDVLTNNYYAMEKWLNETGHPVRFENTFNSTKLAAAEERVVVVHSSAGRWNNADEYILPWIEQGGYLVISLDNYAYYLDEDLLELLSDCGVGVEVINETGRRGAYTDKNVFFTIDEGADVLTINDEEGLARLVEIPLGDGALTVTGMFVFMFNDNLKEEVNANLSWSLTGARANGGNRGVLFIIERQISESKLGKLIARGNLLPVFISAFLLIILGFWMVIPLFGLVSVEKQKNSRPIRERFIAEIHFLKKYRALDHYLNIYEREKNHEIDSRKKKRYNYRELINQYRRIFNGTAKF